LANDLLWSISNDCGPDLSQSDLNGGHDGAGDSNGQAQGGGQEVQSEATMEAGLDLFSADELSQFFDDNPPASTPRHGHEPHREGPAGVFEKEANSGGGEEHPEQEGSHTTATMTTDAIDQSPEWCEVAAELFPNQTPQPCNLHPENVTGGQTAAVGEMGATTTLADEGISSLMGEGQEGSHLASPVVPSQMALGLVEVANTSRQGQLGDQAPSNEEDSGNRRRSQRERRPKRDSDYCHLEDNKRPKQRRRRN
jgi:hypothetical protein